MDTKCSHVCSIFLHFVVDLSYLILWIMLEKKLSKVDPTAPCRGAGFNEFGEVDEISTADSNLKLPIQILINL